MLDFLVKTVKFVIESKINGEIVGYVSILQKLLLQQSTHKGTFFIYIICI